MSAADVEYLKEKMEKLEEKFNNLRLILVALVVSTAPSGIDKILGWLT